MKRAAMTQREAIMDQHLTPSRTVRRRTLLAAAASAPVLATPFVVRAQTRVIQFWGTQRAPEQREAYDAIFAAFAQAHPGFTVNTDLITEETMLPRLSAGFAARTGPDLISHMPAPFVVQLNDQDLVEPMDDVVRAVGESDFNAPAMELFRDQQRGRYMAICVVNGTTPGTLWVRKDLLGDAGLQPPRTWDEMLNVARRTTRRGVFGTIYSSGKNSMGDTQFLQTVWQAGGTIVNPDLSVSFNSPQVIAALEYAKEMSSFSPPEAPNYQFLDVLNGFVLGRAATAPYTGRVLINVSRENPSIADKITCVPSPYRREGRPAFNSDFTALVIPKGGQQLEGAKLLAAWMMRRDSQIRFLHATPGHNLPDLKSVGQSEEYASHPLLQKYRAELQVMLSNTAQARNLLKETPQHPLNRKAGPIFGARVLSETVQDVVVGGISPRQAAARGADKIAAIMRG
jgi:multiple sugar transport system substrate-binding protein